MCNRLECLSTVTERIQKQLMGMLKTGDGQSVTGVKGRTNPCICPRTIYPVKFLQQIVFLLKMKCQEWMLMTKQNIVLCLDLLDLVV